MCTQFQFSIVYRWSLARGPRNLHTDIYTGEQKISPTGCAPHVNLKVAKFLNFKKFLLTYPFLLEEIHSFTGESFY